MRHQNDSDAGLGQRAHALPQAVPGEDVERVAGFIEQQGPRLVHQCAGNEHTPRFTRRHFANRTLRQVRYLQLRQSVIRQFAVPGINHVMRKDASAAEEAGQDYVASAGIAGAPGQQIVCNNAEQRTQFEDIPAVLPQDGHRQSLPAPRDSIRA